MKVNVNLATRPFVELRPFFLRLRIIMAALAVVAVGLAVGGHLLAIKLHHAQDQMAELHGAMVAAQQQKNRDEMRMHQQPNAGVLDRAHFLNALFLRKSFSWTAVMMDLENVLPVGVQVTSIEPQATAEGDVLIRLRVSGDRDRAVQLVRNLEGSRRFLEPRLSGEASQNKEGNMQTAANANNPNAPTGVEFDIIANYNPLPENEPYRYAKRVEVAPEPGPAVVAPGVSRQARPVAGVGAAMSSRPANAAYPRNGVVLPPYAAGRPNGAVGMPPRMPAGTPQGGGH
jgi:type IV pilus assembly protein PilN